MVQAYLKSVLLRSTETFLTTDFLRTNFNWRVALYKLANPDSDDLPPEWTVSGSPEPEPEPQPQPQPQPQPEPEPPP